MIAHAPRLKDRIYDPSACRVEYYAAVKIASLVYRHLDLSLFSIGEDILKVEPGMTKEAVEQQAKPILMSLLKAHNKAMEWGISKGRDEAMRDVRKALGIK